MTQIMLISIVAGAGAAISIILIASILTSFEQPNASSRNIINSIAEPITIMPESLIGEWKLVASKKFDTFEGIAIFYQNGTYVESGTFTYGLAKRTTAIDSKGTYTVKNTTLILSFPYVGEDGQAYIDSYPYRISSYDSVSIDAYIPEYNLSVHYDRLEK